MNYANYKPHERTAYYFICSLYLPTFFLCQHPTFDDLIMRFYNNEMFTFIQFLLFAAAISPRHSQSSDRKRLTTLAKTSSASAVAIARLHSTTIAGVNHQPRSSSVQSTSKSERPPTTIAGVNYQPLLHLAYTSTSSGTLSSLTDPVSTTRRTSATTVSVTVTPTYVTTSAKIQSTGSTYTLSPEAASQLIPPPATSGSPPIVAIPTPSETPSLAGCYSAPGGVQPDGSIDTGCAAMFSHMWDCITKTAPWTTPYNNSQSVEYQQCVCETSEKPFSNLSAFYRNFTGCSHCITLTRTPELDFMTRQLQNIDSFCRSQNPNAYLFVESFQHWTFLLSKGEPGIVGPLSKAMQGLRPLLTTRPPLANLAYGASAPADGSLRGVTPSLTTYTTTIDNSPATITSLVTWIPTDAGATYNGESASISAALEASKARTSNLCLGRGPCSMNGASLRRPPSMLSCICVALVVMGRACLWIAVAM